MTRDRKLATTEEASASFPLISTATVPTARPTRYGKQLVTHMAHKITGAWDEASSTGYLLFDREGPAVGRVNVSCSPDSLLLRLASTSERAQHLEHIVGIHLARFGARDSLAVSWQRIDGGEGTHQGPLTPARERPHARRRMGCPSGPRARKATRARRTDPRDVAAARVSFRRGFPREPARGEG